MLERVSVSIESTVILRLEVADSVRRYFFFILSPLSIQVHVIPCIE